MDENWNLAYYPRTAESKFPSGDIESLPVPDNVASAGSFVVKLCNINDVDKYDMESVTLFSKCWISES